MKKLIKLLFASLLFQFTDIGKTEDLPKPYIQTTLTSDYMAPQGAVADGKSRQDWISVNPTKNLTLGIWENYSFKEHAVNDRDYVSSLGVPINSNLTASVGFQYWTYPTGSFGNFDSAETASLQYSGLIDGELKYTHLNRDSQTERGERVQAGLSKTINLTKDFLLKPFLSTCYVDNYYGLNGFSQVTPGISLNLSKGNFNASASASTQKGLVDSIKDKSYWSVSVGYQF
ncbi:hypothetical protein KA107_02415 [Candidatus Pacearchaeota archaeon]|nr:hypothetical protein [Candidatus Pacearchaeota archaeon]